MAVDVLVADIVYIFAAIGLNAFSVFIKIIEKFFNEFAVF